MQNFQPGLHHHALISDIPISYCIPNFIRLLSEVKSADWQVDFMALRMRKEDCDLENQRKIGRLYIPNYSRHTHRHTRSLPLRGGVIGCTMWRKRVIPCTSWGILTDDICELKEMVVTDARSYI